MQPEEIKAQIEANIDQARVEDITSDGKHVAVIIVSPAFEGLSPVKRQQLVYSVFSEAIASGDLHALQMKTLTPAQWAAKNS